MYKFLLIQGNLSSEMFFNDQFVCVSVDAVHGYSWVVGKSLAAIRTIANELGAQVRAVA